jgi:hypothetical protein
VNVLLQNLQLPAITSLQAAFQQFSVTQYRYGPFRLSSINQTKQNDNLTSCDHSDFNSCFSSGRKMVFGIKVPFIVLKRDPFSIRDFIWAIPVMCHLSFVAGR